MEAPIINRYLRMKKQVLEPTENGLTFEGLIDALLVLYEECSHDKTKSKNEVVVGFLAKFHSLVQNYSKLRVNVGDFHIKRVIGRGNFGEVKLAKEKSSGGVYALKVSDVRVICLRVKMCSIFVENVVTFVAKNTKCFMLSY